MLKRFNFYDIYGYLLPGIAFLILLWLPFAVIDTSPFLAISGDKMPNPLVFSFLGLVVAYIVGHALHSRSAKALSFSILDNRILNPKHNKRYPSDLYLDSETENLPNALKKYLLPKDLREQLETQIDRRFGIKVGGIAAPNKFELMKSRKAAFLLCRDELNHKDKAVYVEQLQGMYAMLRSLSVTFMSGCIFHFGWAIRILRNYTCDNNYNLSFYIFLMPPFLIIIAVGLYSLLKKLIWKNWKFEFRLILIFIFILGFFLGWVSNIENG